MTAALALLLAAGRACAAPAASPVPAAVAASTAPYRPPDVTADAGGIESIKKLIAEDQRSVQKERVALKRARNKRDLAAAAKAEEAWRQAKDKLRLDKEALRASIEAREKERAESRRLRDEMKKSKELSSDTPETPGDPKPPGK